MCPRKLCSFALTVHIQMVDQNPNPGTAEPTSPQQPAGYGCTDLPLSKFPAKAAFRSMYLGEIYQQSHKSTVGELLVAKGISADSFKLYWQTDPVSNRQQMGFCWVEFRTRDLAIRAWARLSGLPKWQRKLTVGPVVCRKHRQITS